MIYLIVLNNRKYWKTLNLILKSNKNFIFQISSFNCVIFDGFEAK